MEDEQRSRFITMLHTWGHGCPLETDASKVPRAVYVGISVQAPESHQVTPTLSSVPKHSLTKHSLWFHSQTSLI